MGDLGEIFLSGQKIATVSYTQKPLENMIVHRVEDLRNGLEVGQSLNLCVDAKRRRGLRQHHSVTHLLHSALRHVLGEHVTQKGSLVEEDRLRFDFTHAKGLSTEETNAIEMWVNHHIQENHPTKTLLQSPEDAMKAGAMALFGEKYGDTVRVVSMGDASIELCGGTHVKAVGEIGFFKITSESGIAAGIRRIEAVAGKASLSFVHEVMQQQQLVCSTLKTSPSQLFSKVEKLVEDQKVLVQQLSALKQKLAEGTSSTDKIEIIGNHQLLIKHTEDVEVKDLKSMMDTLKKRISKGVIFLSGVSEDKVTLLIGHVGEMPMDAPTMIRALSPLIGGKGGGGRPDLAQAGGDNPKGLEKAVTYVRTALSV
jgi:alanyl-tRNA synthetase